MFFLFVTRYTSRLIKSITIFLSKLTVSVKVNFIKLKHLSFIY